MKKLKRVLALFLLTIICACNFAGCAQVPKDEIQINIVTTKVTYHRDEDVSEIFFLFDILNGKRRAIERFEVDAIIYFRDGTHLETPLRFDKEIPYARSTGAPFTLCINGRVDNMEIGEFKIVTKSFWQTFGGLIIAVLVIAVIVGFLFLFFAMGDMYGIISLVAGGLVLLNVALYIFIPFINALIVTIGILLAFVPLTIYRIAGGY